MSTDFETAIKESNLIITGTDEKEHILTCTILEFHDKILINLSMDGKVDIFYDLQIPAFDDLKKPKKMYDYEEDEVFSEEEDETILNSSITPVLLIGAGHNLKTQVLASQIGHVMGQHTTKNIILSLSGRMFSNKSQDDIYHPNDTTVVKQAIHIVVDTYVGH